MAVGTNHFNKQTIKALGAKGIKIIGITSIPDENGSFLNSQTGYQLDDNGTHKIRLYMEVLEIAK